MRLFLSKKELALKKKRTVITVIGLGLVLGVYLIVTHRSKPQPDLPTVVIAPALKKDVEIYGEYVGRVRAQQFVEVRARVEGYLEKMLFAEGTYVKKNQVLFVINQDQYKAKVDKARAQLKKDEAQAQKAKRDLERIRPLYEQNAASKLDLDNAIAAYETAKASVGMSKADLDQAELELGRTVVCSPIAGHISERHVDLGTLVGPGAKSLLASVVKSDTVLIDFSMTALGAQCTAWPERLYPFLATQCDHHPCQQQNLSAQRIGRLCRASGRSTHRNFLRTCRDAKSQPRIATRSVYQGKTAARCTRTLYRSTQEIGYYRKRWCLHLCDAPRLYRGTPLHRARSRIPKPGGSRTRPGCQRKGCDRRHPQTLAWHKGETRKTH